MLIGNESGDRQHGQTESQSEPAAHEQEPRDRQDEAACSIVLFERPGAAGSEPISACRRTAASASPRNSDLADSEASARSRPKPCSRLSAAALDVPLAPELEDGGPGSCPQRHRQEDECPPKRCVAVEALPSCELAGETELLEKSTVDRSMPYALRRSAASRPDARGAELAQHAVLIADARRAQR